MGTETENEETANCLGTEGGGEKIRVSIGNGHLGRESEAGRAASERRTAKTKARAERGGNPRTGGVGVREYSFTPRCYGMAMIGACE